MADYQVGDLSQLNASFVLYGTTTPIDPTAVSLFVRAPDGTITEYAYPAGIVKVSVGVYYYQLLLTESGIWRYQWQGTGAAQVSSPVVTISVDKTPFSLAV